MSPWQRGQVCLLSSRGRDSLGGKGRVGSPPRPERAGALGGDAKPLGHSVRPSPAACPRVARRARATGGNLLLAVWEVTSSSAAGSSSRHEDLAGVPRLRPPAADWQGGRSLRSERTVGCVALSVLGARCRYRRHRRCASAVVRARGERSRGLGAQAADHEDGPEPGLSVGVKPGRGPCGREDRQGWGLVGELEQPSAPPPRPVAGETGCGRQPGCGRFAGRG